MATVAMMGTPAGTSGTRSTARTIAITAITCVRLSIRRGHTSPRKAAGTAASRPHAEGYEFLDEFGHPLEGKGKNLTLTHQVLEPQTTLLKKIKELS